MKVLKYIERVPDLIFPKLKQQNFALYVFWREICHLIGVLLIIFFAHYVLRKISYELILVLFVMFTIWMTYQEFELHPQKYDQPLWKGVLDWLVWITPLAIYLLLI